MGGGSEGEIGGSPPAPKAGAPKWRTPELPRLDRDFSDIHLHKLRNIQFNHQLTMTSCRHFNELPRAGPHYTPPWDKL